MIGGATAAIAVRNERRKNHKKEKNHMEKLGRPNRLLLNPNGVAASPSHLSPAASLGPSRTPSRAGSFSAVVAQTKWGSPAEDARYGDECWGGRVSLLHFMVIFLLAGVTILIVGAVQYKEEAELFKFRKIIITIGFSVLGTGFLLFFIKCVCFCQPRGATTTTTTNTEKQGTTHTTTHIPSRKCSLDQSNGVPVVVGPEDVGQEMVTISDNNIIVNASDGLQPLAMSELENTEQIIQAEVEICYSDLDNP